MALRPLNTLSNRRGEKRDGDLSSRSQTRSGSYILGKREVFADIERRNKRRRLEQNEDSLQESEEDELVQDPSPRRNGTRTSNIVGSRYGSQLVAFPPNYSTLKKVDDMVKSDKFVAWSQNEELTKTSTGSASYNIEKEKSIVHTRSLGLKSKASTGREDSSNGQKGWRGAPRTPRSPTSVRESSSPDVLDLTNSNQPAKHEADGEVRNLRTLDEKEAGPNNYEHVFPVPEDESIRKAIPRSPSVEINHERSINQPPRKGRPQRRLLSQNQMPTRSTKLSRLNFPIEYFAVQNIILRKSGMKLTTQDENQLLLVETDGSLQEETFIPVGKIQKALMSNFDTGVRTRLFLSLNHDNQGSESNKVDIKFLHYSDLKRFGEFLRFRAKLPNLVYTEESKLDRMFKRREETLIQYHTNQTRYSQMDDPDVILAIDHQNRQTDLAATDDVEEMHQTRPRKKLISRLERDSTKPQRALDDAFAKIIESEQDILAGYTALKDNYLLDKNEVYSAGIDAPAINRPSRRTRKSGYGSFLDDHTKFQSAISPPKYSVDKGLGRRWRHPLEYPKTGKKRVTVEFGDLIRLDEGECLNDNLVEFYLRRLQINLETEKPQTAKKIYWFNTYFYESLSKNVGRNEINYDSVKRWTRSEDIFSYDYVIVPINESWHWYVVIICNLPALSHPQSTDKQLPEGESSSISILDDIQTSLQLLSNSSQTLQQPVDEPSTRRSFSELRLEDESLKKPGDPKALSEEHVQDVPFTELIKEPKVERDGQKPLDITGKSLDGKTDQRSPETIPTGGEVSQNNATVQSTLIEDNGSIPSTQSPKGTSRKKRGPPLRTYDPKEPAIITLDSLGVSHAPTVRALKTYLMREAVDKKGEPFFSDSQLKGMNAKGIPQQENFVDCGLYLLGYMEKFASNPSVFVSSILQKQFDEYKDWPSLKPSSMRAALREEIFRLHKEQEGERNKARSTPGSSTKEPYIQRSMNAKSDGTGELRDVDDLNNSLEKVPKNISETAPAQKETQTSGEAFTRKLRQSSPLSADKNDESLQDHQASQQLQISLAESQLSSEDRPSQLTHADTEAHELVTVMVPDSQENVNRELSSVSSVEPAKVEATFEQTSVLSDSENQNVKSSPKQRAASGLGVDSPNNNAKRRKKKRSSNSVIGEEPKKEQVVISLDEN